MENEKPDLDMRMAVLRKQIDELAAELGAPIDTPLSPVDQLRAADKSALEELLRGTE